MMVIAKCEKCGKEYQLEPNKKLSDFQCECGGELSSKEASETVKNTNPKKIRKTWSEQSKGAKAGGIILLLCLGVVIILVISGISGIFSNNSKATDDNPIFQNQYVSFEYPTGYDVQPITGNDASNNIMDIGINKDGKLVGEVMYFENQPADIARMKADPSYVSSTIAGKNALESSDSAGLDGWILLGTTSKGFQKYVNFEVDPDKTALYQKIKSTIVIKKAFPDESN